jgi:GH15 family glucan-1,4-alpha-glucosidase
VIDAAPIEDHAVVGDGRSAALVDRAGAVSWLAWPDFDAPALLAGILDPAQGGHLTVRPEGRFSAGRAYLDRTNVLATRFDGAGGALRLLDFMALAGAEGELRRRAYPEHELLRLAECAEGEVDVRVEADLRPGFGGAARALRDRGPLGLRLERDVDVVTLRASVPLAVGPDGVARARVRLRAGERIVISLAYDREAPAVLPPLEEADEALRRTTRAWRSIAGRVRYGGPWRDEVVRSVLVLELLSYPPTGAIVAAPTTSLPERPGGSLNWDYRYCWLRDAALTVRALYGVGCTESAAPFTAWLLHTTRLTRPALRILYDVYGRAPQRERLVPRFSGHRGAWPIRVGNAAAEQEQLDVYGEVVDAVAQGVRRGAALDRDTQAMLIGFGEEVCRRWAIPDAGIWEPRELPSLRVHSLVLGWVALTRLVELGERGALRGVPVGRFTRERNAIRRLVETRGFDERLGSYVARVGGHEVDAALLLLGWYGYEPPSSPRMRGTWRRIRERLSPVPGLLYRTEESREAGEGAFGICSAWAIEHLARGGGSVEEAVRWLEELLSHANDVGLLGEEIDPRTGAALGNFPQAFTHVGVVNAVLTLDARVQAERERGWRPAGPEEART